MIALWREFLTELKGLARIAKRTALVFALTFVAFTALPATPGGWTLPPSMLRWMGDSLTVHVLDWLEGFLLPHGETLIAIGPFDAFLTIMQVGLYLSLIVSIPYFIAELVHYARSAMLPQEHRQVVILGGLGALLFAGGSMFSLLVVLPPIYRFSYALQPLVNAAGTISITAFIGTTFLFTIGLGLAFEIPALCLGLAYVGVLHTETMRKYWWLAGVGSFAIAFMLSTGATGGILETVTALTLMGLYGIGYLLVKQVEKGRMAQKITMEATEA